MALPLIAIDLITRTFGYNIDFYDITGISPNLFTITWIILFIGLSLNFKKKIGKDLKKKWYDDEPEEKIIKGIND